MAQYTPQSKKRIIALLEKGWKSLELKNLDAALNYFYEVIRYDPKNDRAFHLAGFVLSIQNRLEEAENMVHKALDLYKWCPSYYNTLAAIKKELGKEKEAKELLLKSLIVKPNCAETYNNLGMVTSDSNYYRKAIELEPNAAFIHFNYALCLLAKKDYKEGWKEYEWRRKLDGRNPPLLPTDFLNKKVLVTQEQGLGDMIQFIRYAPLLKQKGAVSVSVTCDPVLERLFSTIPGIDHVNADNINHDLALPTLSLPSLFDYIPLETPYFFPVDNKKLNGYNIGFALLAKKEKSLDLCLHRGENDTVRILPSLKNLAFRSAEKRSIPPSLFKLQGYNLQPFGNYMKSLPMNDLYDVAQWILAMDLIISIDTAVAHLAGALGKKTWVLLPYDSEWRWNEIWYPSVRLFRQKNRGNWESVVDEIHVEVTKLMK